MLHSYVLAKTAFILCATIENKSGVLLTYVQNFQEIQKNNLSLFKAKFLEIANRFI